MDRTERIGHMISKPRKTKYREKEMGGKGTKKVERLSCPMGHPHLLFQDIDYAQKHL